MKCGKLKKKKKNRVTWREPDFPRLDPGKTLRTQRDSLPSNKEPGRSSGKAERERSRESTEKTLRAAGA